MNNPFLIDLDRESIPENVASLGSNFSVKLRGKLVIKNGILENIDTLSSEDLRYILTSFKDVIPPVATSGYIPSPNIMEEILKLAPELKVRFKIEKPGCDPLLPISALEYFEGLVYFDEILKGIHSSWTDIEKFKYLYNATCLLYSYDLDANTTELGSETRERYARNIFLAVTKNIAICSTFASTLDYLCYRAGLESEIISEEDHDYLVLSTSNEEDFLGDPTFDSVSLKFGLKSQYFAVSKEEFAKEHNLSETETDEYEFSSLTKEELETLDIRVGYLSEFDGHYMDDEISNLLAFDVREDLVSRVISLVNRVLSIKVLGRPGAYDYKTLLNRLCNATLDEELASSTKVFTYMDNFDTPRVGFAILDGDDKRVFAISPDFKEIEEVNEIVFRRTLYFLFEGFLQISFFFKTYDV